MISASVGNWEILGLDLPDLYSGPRSPWSLFRTSISLIALVKMQPYFFVGQMWRVVSTISYFSYLYLNPLGVDVLYVSYVSVFACSGCSASHRQNHQKLPCLFLREEKICYKNGVLNFLF